MKASQKGICFPKYAPGVEKHVRNPSLSPPHLSVWANARHKTVSLCPGPASLVGLVLQDSVTILLVVRVEHDVQQTLRVLLAQVRCLGALLRCLGALLRCQDVNFGALLRCQDVSFGVCSDLGNLQF